MNSDQIAKLQQTIEGLADLTDDCLAAIELARCADDDAVKAARQSGELLIKVKDKVPKKKFLKYCEDTPIGKACSPSWRARVMKLAKHWPEIYAVWEQTDEDVSFTVDGLLKMWRAWKRGEKPRQEKPKRPTLAEYQALEALVKAKDERIQELEGELARYKANSLAEAA
jgi:hypothetical protein